MTMRPVHRSDVMEREVGNERMLYDTATQNVHVFNSSAFFVWQRCDGTHSIDEIVAEAVKTYGASEQEARNDVEECIYKFRELSLLED